MTSHFLLAELASLTQEAKRKNSDLRNATEEAIKTLEGLSGKSEDELAHELQQRPEFVSPLLKALNTRNVKIASIGIVCLQRLIVARAVADVSLESIVNCFAQAVTLGTDIQLKLLQSLPPLVQNYSQSLKGARLDAVLDICFSLQGSKNAIINNTAAATLQQLVVSVFDNIENGERSKDSEVHASDPTTDSDATAAVFADAYRVFLDLCLLTEGGKAEHLKSSAVTQTFGLELLESILSNHVSSFERSPELAGVLRARLLPFLLNALSERMNFPTTVRIIRILYVLIRYYLDLVSEEDELALSLLTRMLDPDSAPLWKRALCMEVFRGIYTDSDLVIRIYAKYDEKDTSQNIVTDNTAALVRLATEKPHIIGLAQQSSAPASIPTPNDDVRSKKGKDSSAVSSIIGGVVSLAEPFVAGLSSQWTSIKIPCIDQLDKLEAPSIPESYIYSLSLICMNAFSEGLARFILPLTIPSEPKTKRSKRKATDVTKSDAAEIADKGVRKAGGRKIRLPINPLLFPGNPSYAQVYSCASMIESCWPAVLALSSTFLNASLDADYYHGLVRSIQKFTHVAGLLRLDTPRDAFLTILSKAAIPTRLSSNSQHTGTQSASTESHGILANARGFLGGDSTTTQTQAESALHVAIDENQLTLSPRNILCLRALINLGIALGPMLDVAWSIVFDTLCQTDSALSSPTAKANLGSESTAVESAALRLLESTIEYSDEAFVSLLRAVCRPLHPLMADDTVSDTHAVSHSPKLRARRTPSFVVTRKTPRDDASEDMFMLAKLDQIASLNLWRFQTSDDGTSGWTYATTVLVQTIIYPPLTNNVRFKAMEILEGLIISTLDKTESSEMLKTSQQRSLYCLSTVISRLPYLQTKTTSPTQGSDIELHRAALKSLVGILEQFGDSLVTGWDLVFQIIQSGLNDNLAISQSHAAFEDASAQSAATSRAIRLVRSSFTSMQLVCNDFLSLVPISCLSHLVDTVFQFCCQKEDLNISLTAVTFLWKVSDFLLLQSPGSEIDSAAVKAATDEDSDALLEYTRKQKSAKAYWIVLLLRFSATTTDPRQEVRDSSIQTLFRILETQRKQLSVESLKLIFQTVVFRAMKSQHRRLSALENESSPEVDESWFSSAILVLSSAGTLFNAMLEETTGQDMLNQLWLELLDTYESFLKFRCIEMNAQIFETFRKVLERRREQDMGNEYSLPVWNLWSSHGIPVFPSARSFSDLSYQRTLTIFVACYNEIFKSMSQQMTSSQAKVALRLMEDCLLYPNNAAVCPDLDHPTELQRQVLESLRIMMDGNSQISPLLIKSLARLSAMPYTNEQLGTASQLPNGNNFSYVAISIQTMGLLENLISAQRELPEIYLSGAYLKALTALCLPIALKSRLRVRQKGKAPWMVATRKILVTLENTFPLLDSFSLSGTDRGAIQALVAELATHVVQYGSTITKDSADEEAFDVAAFRGLRRFLYPALGRNVVDETARANYVEKIFLGSFVHNPQQGDMFKPGIKNALKGLYIIPRGSTMTASQRSRPRISYLCLEELFEMISERSGDSENIRIAQSAAPYTILRCAISIREYIADQPLRGLMPQPLSLRKELLHILRKLLALQVEPSAIPDLPGFPTLGRSAALRKHIYRLYPLLTRAIDVSRRDPQVLSLLSTLVQSINSESSA